MYSRTPLAAPMLPNTMNIIRDSPSQKRFFITGYAAEAFFIAAERRQKTRLATAYAHA
jgi:hypothetical protein